MRLCRSSILIFTCLACLGFDPCLASTARREITPVILELAQASPATAGKQSTLRPGSTGSDVNALQAQLKELGYYDGVLDGKYGESTQTAVAEFQKVEGLTADGVAGATTRDLLQAVLAKKANSSASATAKQTNATQSAKLRDWTWWLLVGLGILGSAGAALYFVKRFRKHRNTVKPEKPENAKLLQPFTDDGTVEFNTTTTDNHYNGAAVNSPQQTTTSPVTEDLLPVEQPSRLTKISIIDELIKDLHTSDPTKRRKAIWDLGQQGDSRAVQPLLDLMIDSDSQQRSLILAALAEIGSRTLKPMNRALAISLQDESPEVRQNAIRDLTRVYDMMAQISQMLCHAVEDPDAEVQATARYALSQMNRIRTGGGQGKREGEGENILPESSQGEPQNK